MTRLLLSFNNQPRRGRLRIACLLICAIALAGCREEPQVTVQERPRTEPRSEPFDVDQWRSSRDHILVAMDIRGDFAWFFKLSAPAEGIEELREQFHAWLASVEFVRDEQQDAEVPDWKNPPGWFNTRGENGQYAEVRVPHDPAPLALSVTRLPVTTKESRYVTMNVNRWLGQLGLRPFEDDEVKDLQQKRPLKVGTVKFFELSGRLQKPPAWRIAANRSRRMQSKEIRFEMPKGWQPGPMNSMRKLSLVKRVEVNEEQIDEVNLVVSTFPAISGMKDPLTNAKRWAGESGIREEDEQLLGRVEERTIGGLDGQYIRLVAEPSQQESDDETTSEAGNSDDGSEEAADEKKKVESNDNRNAVIAAMVQRRDEMWFFKLNGPAKVVVESEADFKKFLDSFEFRESE